MPNLAVRNQFSKEQRRNKMASKYGQITINGEKKRFLKEDLRIIQLVRAGKMIRDKIKDMEKQYQEVEAALIEIADGRKGEQNLVHLDGIDCRASISFSQSVSFDTMKLLIAEEMLGADDFMDIFQRETRFKPQPTLEIFMKQKRHGTEEDVQKIISKAMIVKNRKPTVKFREKK